MDDALAPVAELVRDIERAQDWSKLVVKSSNESVTASPVRLRGNVGVKLVSGARTESIGGDAWPSRVDDLLEGAERVHVISSSGDVHARRTKKGRWLVSRGRVRGDAREALPEHDRRKDYPLPPEHPEVVALFSATGLMTPDGKVRARAADKYRQVQHYVELLRPLPIWERDSLRVLDAGCGKAYMSLALLLYGRLRGVDVQLVGLDSNAAVIESVSATARDLGYESASFHATTIREYVDETPVDLLVSLHACDTATDEALAAGLRRDAGAIVVAPCCHHELSEQISCEPPPPAWRAVLGHGLLQGRLADLVTDALRAAALEARGYRAEVIEFVAAEHTAKNLMIRAVKRRGDAAARRRAEDEYAALKELWGVEPALERLVAAS